MRLGSLALAFLAACGGATVAEHPTPEPEPVSHPDPGTSGVSTSTSANTDGEVPEQGDLANLLGTYTGCTASIVNVSGNATASAGGNGTITLGTNGDYGAGVTLAFDKVANGKLDFYPTSDTSGLHDGRDVESLQTVDGSNASTSVAINASTLTLIGNTLLLSISGTNPNTQFSGFFSCPAPSSVTATAGPPSTTLGIYGSNAIKHGTYAHCTMNMEGLNGTGSESGGDLSLSLTVGDDGSMNVKQTDGYPNVFGSFGSLAFRNGVLTSGQSVAFAEPCGPPPSLGGSTAPTTTNLTNMTGTMQSTGNALFIDVIGDAPAEACGTHSISIICPTAP